MRVEAPGRANPRADVIVVFGTWLLTRILLVSALIVQTGDWHRAVGALTSFDGAWYVRIATDGYSYAPDGGQHNVAFFPLYPAAIWILARTGLGAADAALFISNAAFLAMLFVVFAWIARRAGSLAARWTVATLCCCPLSLFGSAAYSEALYMLLSAAALLAADSLRFRRAAPWVALASATRAIGIAFLPAFLLAAVVRRRAGGLLPALAAATGLIGFSAYCASRFGDPLAWLHVQAAWRHGAGFDEAAWQNLLGAGVAGTPSLHAVALGSAILLWLLRRAHVAVRFLLWLLLLEAERWAWNGTEYVFLLTIVAAVLAIVFRRRLGVTALTYFFAGLVLIALAGYPISVDRFAYALLPASAALALLWRRAPALGGAAMVVMLSDLFFFTLRFAAHQFVA